MVVNSTRFLPFHDTNVLGISGFYDMGHERIETFLRCFGIGDLVAEGQGEESKVFQPEYIGEFLDRFFEEKGTFSVGRGEPRDRGQGLPVRCVGEGVGGYLD